MTHLQAHLKFALMICHPPDHVLRARSALNFAQSALEAGHAVPSIYFYQAGASTGLGSMVVSSDDYNPQQQWQALAAEHTLALQICVGSAQRRGVVESTVARGFSIVGLGQWIAAAAVADRVIRFP